VAESLNRGAGYRSDQGEIWNNLAAKQARMSIHSETGAVADLFEGQKDSLSEYLKAFHLVDSQVGGIFADNGKVASLECFGHWQTFSKFFKNPIQSYALDAIDMYEDPKGDHVAAADIRRFMEGIAKAPRKNHPDPLQRKNPDRQDRSGRPRLLAGNLPLRPHILLFYAGKDQKMIRETATFVA
jgi:hypothetical protein